MLSKSGAVVIVLALMLPLAAAACGGEDSPKTTRIPSEIYTSPNGLRLTYPKDWMVQEEDGVIFVATSENAARGDTLGKGEAVVIILGPHLTAELGAGLSLQNVLTFMAGELGSTGTASGEVKVTALNGHQAARVSLKDDRGEGIGLAVDLGGGQIVVVFIGAAAGELRRYEAIGMAVAGSIVYEAPPAR